MPCFNCRNPNLGLTTKARVCKGEDQEGSPTVWESVKMNGSIRPYANNERRDPRMEVRIDLAIAGWPKLLVGFPKLVPFCPIWGEDAFKFVEKEKFIRGRISKYLEFWKLRVSKDDIYARTMGQYVNYWENILGLLARLLLHQSLVLLEGFWPSSNWKVNHVQASIPTSVNDDFKELVVPPHCDSKNK
jgi:hypothetical protein